MSSYQAMHSDVLSLKICKQINTDTRKIVALMESMSSGKTALKTE